MFYNFLVQNTQESPIRNSSANTVLYSPKSSLRVMREIGISNAGHEKLRRRAVQEGKPHLLSSRRKIASERKNLENGIEYIIEQDVIRLQCISTAVKKRLNHMGPNVDQTALLSLDKGQGRVLVTIAFPYRHQDKEASLHPCSDTNHLVIASWEGADKHEALTNRVSDVYNVLTQELNL